MAIEPIIHDLEYEAKYVVSNLEKVDVTAHYLILLKEAGADEIEDLADPDSFIEALREVFAGDASLLDNGGDMRDWCAYGADLVVDLNKSLGRESDDDTDPVPLVAAWLAAIDEGDVADRHHQKMAKALDEALNTVSFQHGLAGDPRLLTRAFEVLLATPGAFGALQDAIELCGPAEPTGALRTAAALGAKAS